MEVGSWGKQKSEACSGEREAGGVPEAVGLESLTVSHPQGEQEL